MLKKLKALWNSVPDGVKRVLHTFWQAAGGVLLSGLLLVHSTVDVQLLVGAAFASGLAAVKALVVSRS